MGLMDRVSTMQNDQADLDDSTLGKGSPVANAAMPTNLFQPVVSRGATAFTPMSVRAIQDKLRAHGVPPSPMEELALSAMKATESTCSAKRDVRAEAQSQKVVAAEVVRPPPPTPTNYLAGGRMSNKMKVDLRQMAGASAPLGCFDPFGLS